MKSQVDFGQTKAERMVRDGYVGTRAAGSQQQGTDWAGRGASGSDTLF